MPGNAFRAAPAGERTGAVNPEASAPVIRYRDIFVMLKPELTRHRALIVFLPVLTLLAAGCATALPFVQRRLIDVLVERDGSTLLLLLIATGALMALKSGCEILEGYLSGRLENVLSLELRERLYRHLLQLPNGFFSKRGGGYLSGRVFEDVAGVRMLFSQQLLRALSGALGFAGGIVMLFVMDWRLVPGLLLVWPLIYCWGRRFYQAHYRLHVSRSEAYAEAQGEMQQTLSHINLVKSGARESVMRREIRKRMNRIYRIQLEVLKLTTLFGRQLRLVPGLVRMVYLVVGAYLVINGRWTLGFLWAVQGYLSMVILPVQSAAMLGLQMQQGRAAAGRLRQLLEILPEENLESGVKVEKLSGGIELKGVNFAFEGSGRCLRNIDLRIEPGEHVALVGESGAGKSTLLSLLVGFFRPQSGSVMLDGLDIGQYNLRSLRQRIGYVDTTPEFVGGTLRENLLLGNSEAGEKELREMIGSLCEEKYAEKFISLLDRTMGESGRMFSAGEKLRLSIIRELLRDPDILILDEPSATLDALHEKMLIHLLKTRWAERTILTVSHRRSLADKFPRVLLMGNGRIEADGSFEELERSNEKFRRLMNG